MFNFKDLSPKSKILFACYAVIVTALVVSTSYVLGRKKAINEIDNVIDELIKQVNK